MYGGETLGYIPSANASFEVEVTRQTCRELTSTVTWPAECIKPCACKKEGPSWRARAHAKFSDLRSDISSMCPASPAWLTLSPSLFPGD